MNGNNDGTTADYAMNAAHDAKNSAAALKKEVEVLRIVVKDLVYIMGELVELEPRSNREEYLRVLQNHMDSLGDYDAP